MGLAKIKMLLARNPGALFIMVFEVLILACAALLVNGSHLVEGVAVFAYSFLVIGVVLEAWDSVKEKVLGGASS